MAIWSEILAGNNFIVCDLEEVRESMRSWEKIHSSIMSMKSERACKIKSSILLNSLDQRFRSILLDVS